HLLDTPLSTTRAVLHLTYPILPPPSPPPPPAGLPISWQPYVPFPSRYAPCHAYFQLDPDFWRRLADGRADCSGPAPSPHRPGSVGRAIPQLCSAITEPSPVRRCVAKYRRAGS